MTDFDPRSRVLMGKVIKKAKLIALSSAGQAFQRMPGCVAELIGMLP